MAFTPLTWTPIDAKNWRRSPATHFRSQIPEEWSPAAYHGLVWVFKEFAAAASAVAKSTKMVRSSAESVLKRTGKLFRTALVIGKVECGNSIQSGYAKTGSTGSASGEQEKQLVVNIYSRAAERGHGTYSHR